jgi:hypothetical protein
MDIGRILILTGSIFLIIGSLYYLGFGRLPGDVNYHKNNVHISVPIVSSIILSLILTLVLNFLLKR